VSRAKHAVVTEMSDTGAALASGPESPFVVAAIGSILDGDAAAAHTHLLEGAQVTSWPAVLHRIDVAGRALAMDAELHPDHVPTWRTKVAELAHDAGLDAIPAAVGDVLAAWSRGEDVSVVIDLDRATVHVDEDPRAWAAGLVLAWLVERSGFPPQVVA